jgi:hypothetical protein
VNMRLFPISFFLRLTQISMRSKAMSTSNLCSAMVYRYLEIFSQLCEINQEIFVRKNRCSDSFEWSVSIFQFNMHIAFLFQSLNWTGLFQFEQKMDNRQSQIWAVSTSEFMEISIQYGEDGCVRVNRELLIICTRKSVTRTTRYKE